MVEGWVKEVPDQMSVVSAVKEVPGEKVVPASAKTNVKLSIYTNYTTHYTNIQYDHLSPTTRKGTKRRQKMPRIIFMEVDHVVFKIRAG